MPETVLGGMTGYVHVVPLWTAWRRIDHELLQTPIFWPESLEFFWKELNRLLVVEQPVIEFQDFQWLVLEQTLKINWGLNRNLSHLNHSFFRELLVSFLRKFSTEVIFVSRVFLYYFQVAKNKIFSDGGSLFSIVLVNFTSLLELLQKLVVLEPPHFALLNLVEGVLLVEKFFIQRVFFPLVSQGWLQCRWSLKQSRFFYKFSSERGVRRTQIVTLLFIQSLWFDEILLWMNI